MKSKSLFHLSGTDVFFLSMENRGKRRSAHDRLCYYILEIYGIPTMSEIRTQLTNNFSLHVNGFFIKGKNSFFRPRWVYNETNGSIPLIGLDAHEGLSIAECYPELVENHTGSDPSLLSIFLIRCGKKRAFLCMRWDHILMDGQGAQILMNHIFSGSSDAEYYPETMRTFFNLPKFYRMVRHISNSSAKPIFFPKQRSGIISGPRFSVIQLNEVETGELLARANLHGGGTFTSLFLLSLVCASLHEANFWQENADFWVPVPLNARKKGSMKTIFSNNLSFYFFRIKRSLCSSVNDNLKDLISQMKFQARQNYPDTYMKLISFMRFLPAWFFYIFIKGWKRKDHASFMFTMAMPHDKDFIRFGENNIINALSIPPNSLPPGLTFAFMLFQKQLRCMILSRENILSDAEAAGLNGLLHHNLMNLDD